MSKFEEPSVAVIEAVPEPQVNADAELAAELAAEKAKWQSKGSYYEVLGVEDTASADEIKKAYRTLAREHHPDIAMARGVPKAVADEAFKYLNEANEVLGDPEERRKYDGLRSSSSRTSSVFDFMKSTKPPSSAEAERMRKENEAAERAEKAAQKRAAEEIRQRYEAEQEWRREQDDKKSETDQQTRKSAGKALADHYEQNIESGRRFLSGLPQRISSAEASVDDAIKSLEADINAAKELIAAFAQPKKKPGVLGKFFGRGSQEPQPVLDLAAAQALVEKLKFDDSAMLRPLRIIEQELCTGPIVAQPGLDHVRKFKLFQDKRALSDCAGSSPEANALENEWRGLKEQVHQNITRAKGRIEAFRRDRTDQRLIASLQGLIELNK